MLKAEGIHKKYGNLPVLKGVNINLHEGEIVALTGASGAGKSTFLQILGTLDTPDSGTIAFENKEVTSLSSSEQANFRNRKLGFVFQFHHLMPEFTALENVTMPALIAGTSKSVANEKAISLLDRLGLKDRIEHKPSELSGGEQQRVSVARALINQPKLILADEPTGNLDSANSDELYNLIFELSKSLEITFLIATHNRELASKADRMYHILDGVMVD